MHRTSDNDSSIRNMVKKGLNLVNKYEGDNRELLGENFSVPLGGRGGGQELLGSYKPCKCTVHACTQGLYVSVYFFPYF